jgi:hypothetical protein
MSFVGQFGPTLSMPGGFRSRVKEVLVYIAGAVISGVLLFALVDALLGDRARAAEPRLRLLGLAMALVALLVADMIRVWAGRTTSCGLNRQTPKRWVKFGLAGIFGWGLDTGLPISTVRATPFPIVGLILVAAGFGTRWIGLLYTGGLTAGLLVSLTLPRGLETLERISLLRNSGKPLRNRWAILLPTTCLLLLTIGGIVKGAHS